MNDLILGIDIGGTKIKLGIVTPGGGVVEDSKIDTVASDGPAEAAGRIEGWYRKLGPDCQGIRAVGVGCAGLVDGKKGVLRYSPNLPGWTGADLGSIFRERFGLPVTVANDANCAAWAEYRSGSGAGSGCFVCLTLGTGVGGGIVIDGRLYTGSGGFAGEIGHQVIMADGPECSCGNRGCLESLVGTGAIMERYARAEGRSGRPAPLDPSLGVKEISRAAGSGDRSAAEVLMETGRILGIGLANIANILNPELIAVGGGVSGAGEIILGPARETMNGHIMGDGISSVRVVAAELGNKASFLGAALLTSEK